MGFESLPRSLTWKDYVEGLGVSSRISEPQAMTTTAAPNVSSRVVRAMPHIAMSEPTPTVLPDPPLEPRRPGEPATVDIPEPPNPAEPWDQPEPPQPPTPRPPVLPPDDDN